MLKNISPEDIRKLLDYDPSTGRFTWKTRDLAEFRNAKHGAYWNRRYAGTEALNSVKGSGYLGGKLLRTTVLAHRVAWAHYHKAWPKNEIDHENHIRTDNRLTNLRETDRAGNARNKKKPGTNTSGVVGVYKTKSGLWEVSIGFKSRTLRLGTFSDKADAINARKDAEWVYGFHENHGN